MVEWLAAQPWCDGKVGMFGISWGGFNSLQITALVPEPLKAVVTACSTDDRYDNDAHSMGGSVLAVDMRVWAPTMLAFVSRPPDPRYAGEGRRGRWLTRFEEVEPFIHTWLSASSRRPRAGGTTGSSASTPARYASRRSVPTSATPTPGHGPRHPARPLGRRAGLTLPPRIDPLVRSSGRPRLPWHPGAPVALGTPAPVRSPQHTGVDAQSVCFAFEVGEETWVLGRPWARLRLTGEVPRGQVVARVCAVAPDGSSIPGHPGRAEPVGASGAKRTSCRGSREPRRTWSSS